jgi:hypothetical protein
MSDVLPDFLFTCCTACCCTACQVDIYSNYEQYGLQHPVGLVRMDVHTHPFRQGLGEVRARYATAACHASGRKCGGS